MIFRIFGFPLKGIIVVVKEGHNQEISKHFKGT
jgi:hypothetical protein